MVQTAYVRISVRDAEKAIADLKRIDSTAAAGFERMVKSAQPATKATQAFSAAQQQAGAAAQGMASRLGPAGTALAAFGPAGLAAAAGVGALSAVIGTSIRAFAAFEQQTFRLQALLKATGNTAGLTIRQIEELAQRLGRDTLASTQGVRDAAGVLLTFRSVSGDTFVRTIELAQDLAAVLGGNLKSTVLQLGKALEDPVQGVSALREAGVSFTAQQKEMIKALVDTGRTAEAQRLILDELAKQVGGAGAGEAGGLAGAADTAAEKWKLLLEQIGSTEIIRGAVLDFGRLADAVLDFGLRARTPADDLADASSRLLVLQAELNDANRELEAARQTFLGMDDAAAERRVAAAQAEIEAAQQVYDQALARFRVAEEEREKEEEAARKAAADAAAEREKERAAAVEKERFDKAREASAKVRAEIEAKAAKADLERLERTTETFADYDAAVAAQVRREAEARKKAAEEAAAARERAEEKAQAAIDREREKAFREAVRNTENLADRLVESGRRFLDALFDDSRDFWQDFADLARSTLLDIAAEQLFRAPANAFAAGLFGTGGATGGANAGGIAGLAGSIGQSLATSAISDAIGLPSIGSILGFGGGGAAAGIGSLAAIPGVNGGAALAAGSGLFGGGGLLGLGAVGGPLALGGLALGGAALLGGFGQKESVGPNASARLTLENGRFVLGATGADNGGRQFLNQAEGEALAAAEVLNRVIDELGLVVDDVPDPVDLATAVGTSFNRTGRNVAEDVLRSGTLGDLTADQIAAALGGGSVLGAEIEAALAALDASGASERLRAAEALIARAAQQEVASRQELVRALERNADAARDVAAGLREGVADLLLDEGRGLAPGARLAEAERQFNQALSLGDAARAQALSGVLLESANAFFGTGSVGAAAVFERIVAGLEDQAAAADRRAAAEDAALAAAEAQLAAVRQDGAVSAETLAAAEATAATAREELAALDAIRAALETESPDAALLRGQLDALERLGAGQDATANAVRDLLTTLSAAAGGPVVSIAAGRAAGGGTDRFAAHVAEVEALRARGYADGTGSAVPGYAWVGERGPELLRFAGGERVVAAATSRTASVDSVALLGQAVELLQASLRVQAAAGDRQAAALARVGDELEQLGGPLRRLAAER